MMFIRQVKVWNYVSVSQRLLSIIYGNREKIGYLLIKLLTNLEWRYLSEKIFLVEQQVIPDYKLTF